MKIRVKEQHRYAPHCFLVIGSSSWDTNTEAIAFKWLDKNGRLSRPAGEMDEMSFLQAIELAVREGLVEPKAALEAVVAGMP